MWSRGAGQSHEICNELIISPQSRRVIVPVGGAKRWYGIRISIDTGVGVVVERVSTSSLLEVPR